MARDTLPGKGKNNPRISDLAGADLTSNSDPDRDYTLELDWKLDEDGVKIYQPGKRKREWEETSIDEEVLPQEEYGVDPDEGDFVREEYGDYTYEEDFDQAYPQVDEDEYEEDLSDVEDFSREGANKKKIGAMVGLAALVILLFFFFKWKGGKPKTLVREKTSSEEQAMEDSREEEKEDQPQVVWVSEEEGETSKEASYEAGSLREPNPPKTVMGTRELAIHYPDQSIENGQGDPGPSDEGGNTGGQAQADPNTKMTKGNRLLAGTSQESRVSSNLPLDPVRSAELPFSLDFSADPALSRQVFVRTGKDGYDLYSRHEASFQGLDPVDLLAQVQAEGDDESLSYPSKLTVRLVSQEEAQAIASDPDLESLVETFNEANSDRRLVLYRKAREGKAMDKLFSAMDMPPLSLDRVEKLITKGTEPKKTEGPLEAMSPEEEWEKLTDKLLADAFRVEWEYNLPLFAAGPFDRLGLADWRADKPMTEPAYEAGLVDLDRDGHPEYLIHASMRGEVRENIQGYWAILTPSKAGLLVQAAYPYGNGDMIYKKDGLVLTSQSRGADTLTFSLFRTAYPKSSGKVQTMTFYQPDGLGKTLTYEDLKTDYNGAYLVPYQGQIYLANQKDYDDMMNLAENAIQGGVQLALSGGPSEDATIIDVNKYLQRNFQELPLSSTAWSKAVPLSSFEGRNEPIRYEDLASEG